MHKRIRAMGGVGLMFAAALTLSACGVVGATSAPAAETDTDPGIDLESKTIEIGSFIPSTGPVPNFKLIASGSKAYVDSVNASGGINGWKLHYTQLDDGYDPARSLAATKELVEKNDVFALVAPIGTPTNAAVKQYAVSEGLPMIGAVSGDPELPTLENYFVLLPNYYNEAKLDTTYAVNELGAEKIAVLYQNDDLGKPALQGAQEAAAALGAEIVTEAAFNVADTDLTAQITQAKDAGADLTIVWGSNANVATAVSTGDRLGFDTQFFAPFYTADPTTYALAGDALDDTMFGSWLLPTTSDQESVKAYTKQMAADGHDDEVGVFSLNGWTNAALFGEGLERITADDAVPTRAALIEALAGFTEVPVGGSPSVTFTATDHAGTRSLSIIQARGGEFFTVTDEPIPFAE